jgi:hypothetical protein
MYKVDTGGFPTQSQGLEALSVEIEVADPVVWGGPWIERGAPADPWGNDYIYVFPGKNSRDGFDLYTLGRDGKSATAGNDPDDINNWDPESGYSYYPRGDPMINFMRRMTLLVLLVACGIYASARMITKLALTRKSR